MSSTSHTDGAAPADRGHRAKRKDKRAARRRAALEAKLASADRLIEKRRSQLSAASSRRAAIAAKLARAAGEGSAPMAYCIKDRQRVAIAGAHPIVLANGRAGIAGLCPSCGSKVMRLGAG